MSANFRNKGKKEPFRQRSHADRSSPKLRVICGLHSVFEAFQIRPRKIEKLWLRQGWESIGELKEIEKAARKFGVSIEVQSPGSMDKVANQSQGVIAFCSEQPAINWEKINSSTHSVMLALDGLEDPHNFGAIIRTAWLLGVDGILHTQDRSVGLTPTVNKVACGGVEHVGLEAVNNFSNHIEELKKNGFWVFGLAAGGRSNLYNLKIPEKIIWMVGAEDKGIRGTSEKLCDELISIPQLNSSASYNASVAAAMTLGETYRQHLSQK